jgi:hypothetical protein
MSSQPHAREDHDFGRIVFDDDNFWWCGQVEGDAGPVPLFIFAGAEGPSERQRQVWRRLRPTLLQTARAIAVDFVRGAGQRFPGRNPSPADFTLDEICLVADDEHQRADSVWTYSLAGDDEGMWRFEMKGNQVVTSARDD